MRDNDFFWEGQSLEVLKDGSTASCEAKLLHISNHTLTVLMPSSSLTLGKMIKIRAFKGKDLFEVQAKILEMGKENVSLEVSEEPKKVQRRNFFRMRTNRTLRIMNTIENLYDISGGGCSFFTTNSRQYNLHMKVKGSLLLFVDEDPVEFEGEVVRIKKGTSSKSIISISFIDMPESQRRRIIMFNQKLLLRQRKAKLEA